MVPKITQSIDLINFTLWWVACPCNLGVGWRCLSGIAWLLRGSIPLLRGWPIARLRGRYITLLWGWSIAPWWGWGRMLYSHLLRCSSLLCPRSLFPSVYTHVANASNNNYWNENANHNSSYSCNAAS